MLLVNPVAGTLIFTVLEIHLPHFPLLELSIPYSSVFRNVVYLPSAVMGRVSKEKQGATVPCREEEPFACAQGPPGRRWRFRPFGVHRG